MKLFEPLMIKGMELRNRIVLTALNNRVGYRGKRAMQFYLERAKGGAALIMSTPTLADVFASEEAWGGAENLRSFLQGVRPLLDALHDAGAKMGVQLVNLSRFPTGLSLANPTGDPVAPSPRIEPHPELLFLRPSERVLRGLNISEIKTIIDKFAKAAARVREAGFDLVELHGAHRTLVCQFFSPLDNRRTDEYGGTLQNRMRFGIECIKAMRKALGHDYPLLYRIGASEYRWGGVNINDTLEYAVELEKAGIDAIDISIADHEPYSSPTAENPMGTFVHLAEAIKHRVSIPVITAGRINKPEVAEAILQRKQADLIGICRQLIADPFWPEKVRTGKFDEVLPCLSCNKCIELALGGMEFHCTVNPAVAREDDFRIVPTKQPKRVFVIGGGPGGMQAASTAAVRGHGVTLFEKAQTLGGQLQLIEVIPHKKTVMSELLNYLIRRTKNSKVKIELGTEGTLELVEQGKPDVVIVATGSSPYVPNILGINEGSNVVKAEEILSGKIEAGEIVVIIGGEEVACDTAEFLSEQGKKVMMLRRGPQIAANELPILRIPLLERLVMGGVETMTGVQYEEITGHGVHVVDNHGTRRFIRADTVVLAAGAISNAQLAKKLFDNSTEKRPEIYLIGDCVQPRNLREAILEGTRVGMKV